MDISTLKLDPTGVINSFKVMPDKSVVTLTGCKIYVPESFRGHNLLSMGVEISVFAFICFVLPNGTYGRVMLPNFFVTSPADVTTVDIEGISYYEFTYTKSSTVIKSKELFKDDIVTYDIFDEILGHGRIPWYFEYEDLGRFFKIFPKGVNRRLVPSHSIGEMFIAEITRSERNKRLPYRLIMKNGIAVRKDYTYIPLRNVQYGASDTLSRIAGSYTQDGFDSALVNPTVTSKPIESLIRA